MASSPSAAAVRSPRKAPVERLDLAELHFAGAMCPGRYLELPGRGTTFVRVAEGPPGAPAILLVHGILATADLNWSTAIPALARDFRVVAIDLRGHGRGIRTRHFSAEDCADDLAAVVRQLGLGRVIVVGYSLGGAVAQLFARRHPEMARGMVLCATACSFEAAGGGRLMRLLRAVALLLPERIRRAAMLAVLNPRSGDRARSQWLLDQVGGHCTRSILQAAAEADRFDSSPWLSEVTCPTTVVVTTRDLVVPVETQLRLSRTVRATSVHEVDGDHFVCVKRPAAFNRALTAACAGLRVQHRPAPAHRELAAARLNTLTDSSVSARANAASTPRLRAARTLMSPLPQMS